LYTTGEIGNACTDLVRIVAKASGIALDVIDAKKVGQEASLIERMQSEGLALTYPALETDNGDLVTETPAIC